MFDYFEDPSKASALLVRLRKELEMMRVMIYDPVTVYRLYR
jgi:hypothetical protein